MIATHKVQVEAKLLFIKVIYFVESFLPDTPTRPKDYGAREPDADYLLSCSCYLAGAIRVRAR